MRYMKHILFVILLSLVVLQRSTAQKMVDYSEYHEQVLGIEESIANENYVKALKGMERLTSSFDYVFLRDLKIAVQLAHRLNENKMAYGFLRHAISHGLTLKEVKREKYLKPLTLGSDWKALKSDYDSLRAKYRSRVDGNLRNTVHGMYRSDQKFAFKYLFRIGQRAKERYGNEKGVQHAKEQMVKLAKILATKGYPGEKLIGETLWMSTILAHHNSISKTFVSQDTLYENVRPKLLRAIAKGEMNPYELAIIEDWRIAVLSDRGDAGYGYLNPPTVSAVARADSLRKGINIRSIALRNGLVDIQDKTGMNLYIDGYPWAVGKIVPKR